MWSMGCSLPTLPWGDYCNGWGTGNAISQSFSWLEMMCYMLTKSLKSLFHRLSQFFQSLLGRARSWIKAWAAIQLSHHLEPSDIALHGEANCKSVSGWLLLLVKDSQSGNNWALQCLQSIHLGLGGKHIFALLHQQPYVQNRKSIPTYKINTLCMHFASGSLLFKCK